MTGTEKNGHLNEAKRGAGVLREAVFFVLLLLYPLRHVHLGIDLWDTAYNYANFTYMGPEHMDPMWMFSTYLANVTGHCLSLLPGGGTLIGMNVYTGLSVSLLAGAGYLFCTRRLGIPKAAAFAGEFLAVSLCWCPTAVLYNYLTYILLFAAVVLLLTGLAEQRMGRLSAAGCCLGTNVLVRFSNIPEAGLILAVWAYAFWEELAAQRADPDGKKGLAGAFLKRAGGYTLYCLAGYAGALLLWFGWIHLRYGIGGYAEGIQRLFAMTDTATDYQTGSMLRGMVLPYKGLIYWIVRMGFFIAVALSAAFAGEKLALRCRTERAKKILAPSILWGSRAVMTAVLFAMVWWLYRGNRDTAFCSFLFYSYDSMYRPAVFFLLLTLAICAVDLLRRGSDAKEKLLAVTVLLVVLLTSLGSNNNVMPSINNLFLTAPYTLWQMARFTGLTGGREPGAGKWFLLRPAALGIWLVIGMLFVHAGGFGLFFVFAESTGVREPFSAEIEGNPVLAGVRMSAERAGWLQETSDFIAREKLWGREVISYGKIPAVSFYFQMPAAFNPWCDLASYSCGQMEKDMAALRQRIDSGEKEKPVVMLEHTHYLLLLGERETLEAEGVNPEWLDVLEEDPKWVLLQEFLSEYGYRDVFDCEKLAIWK